MTESAQTAGRPIASPLRRYELRTTDCSEVVSLDFHRGDRHRPPTLEIAVTIDRRQARAPATLALRLAGLIDVVAVREY
ncbi:MAG: hypothetical protein M3071_02335 [Actinomycetota bacterium]|nr:hypothetical protein [Actinomycetota bacterium]